MGYSNDEHDSDMIDEAPFRRPKPVIPQQIVFLIASVLAHGILFMIAYFFMGDSPVQQEVKIELNTKIHHEVREELKPEVKPDIMKTEKRVEMTETDSPNVEDPVVKEAKVSDHNESANEEDFHASKGDREGISDSPLEGKLTNKELGVGGGAGGMFGDRFGGRENLVKKGGSPKTESAVQLGLLWLKRHQGVSGAWEADKFSSCCGQETDYPGLCDGVGQAWTNPGITGLALLCFLGAGNSTSLGEFKEQVRAGVQYLIDVQDTEGCFGQRHLHYMYNHAIATLAMAEAYTLSNYNPMLKDSAQRGVDFLVAAQNPGKAWRYTYRCNDNDTSVTGWCIMALKSARAGGLNVPDTSFESAKDYLNSVTNDYYLTGYTQKGEGSVNVRECMTAVAMTARVFMGTEPTDAYLTGGAGLLQVSLPVWEAPKKDEGRNAIDYYYWYYGTLAMFQMSGMYWDSWNEKMKDVLVTHQCLDGCAKGSWPPEDNWSSTGGRVYATAINVLSLEIYYRYAQVFK